VAQSPQQSSEIVSRETPTRKAERWFHNVAQKPVDGLPTPAEKKNRGASEPSLDDREIDFDLIEPTGMDGPVNEHQVGILALEPLDCPGTSMRRTVCRRSRKPFAPGDRMLLHDLIDQAIKGGNSGFGFAATEEFGLVDVQGGQIGPGSQPLVFMLDFIG